MMKPLMQPSCAIASVLLGALFVAVPPARADVVTAIWLNNTTYVYEVTHMTDFDQRRMPGAGIPGLPGDGSMYCAPTATMNMMAYAARHGFPFLNPGPANWQMNIYYNQATENLHDMGLNMSTNASTGTGGQPWYDGAIEWLQDSGGLDSFFTVDLQGSTGLLGPTLNLIAKKAIQGNLVSPAYGRYERIGTLNGFPLLKRTGGHVVTLARAERVGPIQKLWVRDPADDPADTSQSPFVNRLFNVTNVLVYVQTDSGNVQRVYSALDYVVPAVGEKVRFIDAVMTIRPKFGLAFINTGDPVLQIVQPFGMVGLIQTPSQIKLASEGAMLDGIISNDQTEAFTLQQLPGVPPRLHRTDLSKGETQPIADAPDANQIVMSPKPAIYVLSPEKLLCIDLTEEVLNPKTIPLPLPGDAMTYDSKKKEVVMISVGERKLMTHNDLEFIPCIFEIPASIPLKGLAKIAIDPTTGKYWVLSQASHKLFGWSLEGAGPPEVETTGLPDEAQPTAIDFDDQGHMYVSHEEGMTELRKGGASAGWIVVPDSKFADVPPGSIFRISRSQTNFDPLLHSGPGWDNLDPEELEFGQLVLDCYSDITHNGVTDVDDLLALINEWGNCPDTPCPQDTTGNRIVDVDDLLDVINGWGLCK